VIQNNISFIEDIDNDLLKVGVGYSFAKLGALTAKKGFSGLEFASGVPGSVGGAIFMNAGAFGQCTADAIYQVEFVNAKGELQTLTKDKITFDYRTSSFQDLKGAIVAATFKLSQDPQAKDRLLEYSKSRYESQPKSKKSSGCIFKNPPGESAGKLIDLCHLKGLTIGDARVSTEHANFIINQGDASSKDVAELINKIKTTVLEQKGIELELEVEIVPYHG